LINIYQYRRGGSLSNQYESFPKCFSDIDTVFPMTEMNLRMSPETCMSCKHKTACLREAIQKDQKGISVQQEYIDRAYETGTIGFWSRWSRKKTLHRNAQQKIHGKTRRKRIL